MQKAVAYIEQTKAAALAQLTELIAIPSVSTDVGRIDDMRRCADWLAAHLHSMGMSSTRVIDTAGHPIVYSDWSGDEGAPTLLVYGHYDVQPPDPVELWTSPPFQATVRDGRLYARGSSDDKGQLFIHLTAIEAYLRAVGSLPINLKIILEGEEEIGGPSLHTVLVEHKQ